MGKRFTAFLLVIMIGLLQCQTMISANVSFPDLKEGHWAFDSVMKLVGEGTIKGFEDGQFKPDNTVSRAEFVKMIGKGNVKKEQDFNDITTSHWGYEYIMYSGLRGDNNNNFNPDVPITRFDVLQLIWERAGRKMGVIAPKIITDQGANKDAIAWGYVYGLMRGNDGLHLRLDDVLSRAEAAALIIRARAINDESPKYDFVNTVQPEVLKKIFESVKLFDNNTYEPTKTITNGELARAALRLGSEEYNLTYKHFVAMEPFKHSYAKELYVVGNDILGKNNINEGFIEQKATIKDTLAAMTYFAISKANNPLPFAKKDDYHKDIQNVDSDIMNICLTFANRNGVQLYADGKINAAATVTHKEFAGILLQLDYLMGSQSASVIDNNKQQVVEVDVPLEKDLSRYSENSTEFQCVLKDMPKEVYAIPFYQKVDTSKALYDFAREYDLIFVNMLKGYNGNIKEKYNVNAKITYYPALVCDSKDGHTIRVKVEIIDTPSELPLKSVFNGGDNIDGTQTIHKGMVFYGDIFTGEKVSDIYLSFKKASLEQIVFIEKKQ